TRPVSSAPSQRQLGRFRLVLCRLSLGDPLHRPVDLAPPADHDLLAVARGARAHEVDTLLERQLAALGRKAPALLVGKDEHHAHAVLRKGRLHRRMKMEAQRNRALVDGGVPQEAILAAQIVAPRREEDIALVDIAWPAAESVIDGAQQEPMLALADPADGAGIRHSRLLVEPLTEARS